MAAKRSKRTPPSRRRSSPKRKPFDMALIQRGARLQRSPFFDKTLAAGCKSYTIYNHTFLPSYYSDPVTEYSHLLKDVALWDVAVERNVEIRGPDGFEFMQLLTPRDVSKCRVGQGKYVLITDEDGGILNDPVLLRLEENRFWIALADSDVLLWAKGVARHAGMDVRITEPDASPLQVQGPKSKALMADLFGDKVTSLAYYFFMTIDNNPYEVDLDRLVDLNKMGDFVGKSALQRIHDAGPTRKLVGIEIHGKPIEFNMMKWPVRARGKAVG